MKCNTQEIQSIFEMLKNAIKELYENDEDLFTYQGQGRSGMEQACAFRIGHYLCKYIENSTDFNYYNVDMEYNKKGTKLKCNEVQPDLIIHKRNCDDNLLVVEFKYYSNRNTSKDVQKLIDFTGHVDYRYKIGVSVMLEKDFNSVQYICFKDGQEIPLNE